MIPNNNITGGSYPDNFGRPIYIRDGIILIVPNNATLTGNTIHCDFDDAGILIGNINSAGQSYGDNPIITGNSIDNTFSSTGIKISDSGAIPIIQSNAIRVNNASGNSEAIKTASSSVKINYNNLHGGNQNLYLTSTARGDINATYNWWGTTDAQAIN